LRVIKKKGSEVRVESSGLSRTPDFFFTLVTGPRRSLSLKLSDTKVYEPQIPLNPKLGEQLLACFRYWTSSTTTTTKVSRETETPLLSTLNLEV